ncbi:MAG TPA: adenylyltransferase/cytidyltransferase family protein [Azospirillaceae bacterium]|nr:adenylyltransferase/cytidyltransferase family protein [Azospirillaceae bacterium]HRQ79566.1 adenylyltransferase/cytidyltransferase family protein [Azospirillaceae bacterium]
MIKLSDPDASITPRWRVGYASGAFDLLHVGHLRYLTAAAAQCDRLLVGIPDDAIITRVKGRPPTTPLSERLEMIAGFACVARAMPATVSMDETERFAAFLRGLTVDAVFIGEAWAETPRWSRLRPALEASGIAVVFLPHTPGVSSTLIKERAAGSR